MAFANDIRTAGLGLGERIEGALRAARTAWKRHRIYRRTLDELSALSNRELADLGIARCEIRRLALEAARNTEA